MDKNSISRRRFLRISATTAAGGLLVACAPEPERIVETVEVQIEGETVVVTATPLPPEAVSIRFIATAPPEYYRIDAFSQENPLVDVAFEDIGDEAFDEVVLTSVASGNPPELAWASAQGLWRFAQVGAILEISNIMKNSPHPELDMIDPKAIAQYNSPGFFQRGLVMMAPGQYGWPVYNTFYVMIYNKQLLEAAGVDFPQRGWTWEQWREMLLKVNNTDTGVRGLVFPTDVDGPNFVHSMIWANGGRIYDDNGKSLLASPEAVEAVRFLQDLFVTDKTAIPASGAEGVDFLSGNVAFQYWGNFIVGWYDFSIEAPYGVAPLPLKKTEIMFDNVDGFMFLAGAAHPEAGWEYAKWLTSVSGQTVLNDADQVEVLSVNQQAAQGAYINPGFGIPEGASDWFLSLPFTDAARYRPWIPVGPGFNYDTAFDGIWLGDDVEETLAQIAASVDAMNESMPSFG